MSNSNVPAQENYWPLIQAAFFDYWIIGIGLVTLYFWGRYHFNTPNYALGGNADTGDRSSSIDPTISKINGLVPPMYTTTISQYWRYMFRYILILQIVFILVTFSREFTSVIGQYVGGSNFKAEHVPAAMRERAVWALFLLTGLLTSFPVLKQLDGFILRTLHKSANVPDGVENTAQYLLEAKYKPSQAISDDIFASIRTHHFREVIAGREIGSLESSWFELRCIREVVKDYILANQIPVLQNVLQSDVEEASHRVDDMRDHLFRYSKNQDRLLPASIDNVDEYLMEHTDDPEMQDLLIQRRKFISEVKALKLRFCRLCSLAVFANERRSESIDQILKNLGFGVRVVDVPRWHWESIFKVALLVLLATSIPSAVYGTIAHIWTGGDLGDLSVLIPAGPRQVFVWAIMAATLHTIAVVVALAVKRFYARRRSQRQSSDIPENIVCLVSCYVVCLLIQIFFTYISKAPIEMAFAWATLPAATGYYVGKYIDKSRDGRPISNLRSIKQAGVTAGLALFASIVTLINDFSFDDVPLIVKIFIVYAPIVGGSIGFAVGQTFQRAYSHSMWTEDLAVRPDVIERSGARIIGDFIVQKCDNDARPQRILPLSGGAGI